MKEVEEIQLPEGWIYVKLGDFVQSEKGKKPKFLSVEKTEDFSIPYVDIQAFEKGIVDRYTNGDGCKFCEAEDFLMVWDGSRSGLVGKAIEGAIGSTIVKISFPGISNDYAYYFLQSKYIEINTRAKGSGVPHVDPNLLWNYQFPLPPLAEQHRIVAKIEELFSELDNGVAQLKQVQAQLKSYRQSVLKHAFEGKLTEAYRSQQSQTLPPAPALLNAIRQERKDRHQQALKDWQQEVIRWAETGKHGKKPTKPKAPKELPPLTDEEVEKMPALPEGWMWVKFDQLIASLRNGISKKPLEGGKLPILRISSTRPFKVDLSDRRYLDFDSSYDSYTLINGDLLFTRYNGSRDYVGVCGMVRNLSEKVVYPDKLIRCRIANEAKILPTFIEYAANSGASRKFILNRIRTTAGQSGVSGGDIYAIPIPLCSTEEQHQIVQEIESRLSVAEHLERTVEESLRQAEVLRQSILQRAFTGQLVSQDPNDEPAVELLKRVQEEKSGGKKKAVEAKASGMQTDEQLSITF